MVDGLTVVDLRYRGLGKLEQTLTADGQGAAREAWMTGDIIPGSAGDAPHVSPSPSTTRVNAARPSVCAAIPISPTSVWRPRRD